MIEVGVIPILLIFTLCAYNGENMETAIGYGIIVRD